MPISGSGHRIRSNCCFLALAVIAAAAIAARTGCMAMGALKHPEKLNVMRGCHGMCAD